MIGYAVGSVCPFAVNDGVDVYLDTFAKVQHRFPSLRERKQRYRLVLGRAGQILSIERLGRRWEASLWVSFPN